MRSALSIYLVGLALVVAPAAQQSTSVTAATGPAILTETGGTGTAFAMTDADYQKLAAQASKMPSFVTITKRPAAASPSARYGINLGYAGKNRGWMLDGNDTDGYTLYPDLNANGDLTDDTPIKMEIKDGKPSAYITVPVTEAQGQYEVRFFMVVDNVTPPGKTDKELAMRMYTSTHRAGEAVIDGAPMKFAVSGSQGLYDSEYVGIQVDLNRDGKFDPVVEAYKNSEKYFNIGTKSYEFKTDRYGSSVTFTPTPDVRPARAVLLPGYAPPDMPFVDLDGKTRHLSDYRGSVVLLDFWGTWCGPCVAATPELVEMYAKYHARGLEIIGVDSGDTREQLVTFMAEKKVAWPQTMESDKGRLATAFRVNGWPTYFIIGRDGKFVTGADTGGEKFKTELEKLFAGK